MTPITIEDPSARDESEAEPELQRELLRHYLKTADAKVSNIENEVIKARLSGGDGEARRPLIVLLHTLAGNAGTYGFKEISRRAREIERALIAEKDAAQLSAAMSADLTRFLEEMRQAFAAARATL